jgi:putative copper resistance protein D
VIEAGLVVSRFLHYAALMVLLGCALFPRYPHELSDRGDGPYLLAARLQPSIVGAVLIAFLSALSWFAFTTAGMTDSLASVFDPGALRLVGLRTGFGQVWTARLVLIALAAALFTRSPEHRASWAFGAVAAALAVVTLALVGHGTQGEGAAGLLHRTGDALHLLASAVWIGALYALSLLIVGARSSAGGRDADIIHDALTRFSGVGPGVVAVLLLTGIANSWFLIGPEKALASLSTPYGQVLLNKIILFLAMLGLAAGNRYWLTPLLASDLKGDARGALKRLRRSVVAETILAVLVLGAVAYLGTLAPPGSGD